MLALGFKQIHVVVGFCCVLAQLLPLGQENQSTRQDFTVNCGTRTAFCESFNLFGSLFLPHVHEAPKKHRNSCAKHGLVSSSPRLRGQSMLHDCSTLFVLWCLCCGTLIGCHWSVDQWARPRYQRVPTYHTIFMEVVEGNSRDTMPAPTSR